MKQAKEKKRLEVLEMYKTAPFEELVAAAETRAKQKRHQLHDILDKIATAVDAADLERETTPPPPVPPLPTGVALSSMTRHHHDDGVDGQLGGGGSGSASSHQDHLDGQLRMFLPVIMERTAEPPAKLFQIPDYKPPPFFEMKFPDLMIY